MFARLFTTCSLFLGVLLAAGCGPTTPTAAAEPTVEPSATATPTGTLRPAFASTPTPMLVTPTMTAMATMMLGAPASASGGVGGAGAGTDQRSVIMNASLRLVVESPVDSAASISRLAVEAGGWVVSSNASRTVNVLATPVYTASLTVRVPADKLAATLEKIKGDAFAVESENLSGQDVSQEFTDLRKRLANLESAEEQLRKLMDRATTTNDVLNILNQLTRTRSDIESLKGRLEYLGGAVAYSSISITLLPKPAPTLTPTPTRTPTPTPDTSWRPSRTAETALNWLVGAGQTAFDLLIWALVVGIPLVVVLGVVWVAQRALRRTGR